jgi:quercetin dioxygenase-like cupin family protein
MFDIVGDEFRAPAASIQAMRTDAFTRREVTIPPGGERPYDPAEWWDSLVTVERGEVELDCRAGAVARFTRGDILWLTGLGVCALRNTGDEPAVLVAVSRRLRA